VPLDDCASQVVSVRIVVSILVSFAKVHDGSGSINHNESPLVRTKMIYRERRSTNLESVLAATPREFESRI
jgi:hypothetical protein